MGRLRLLAMLLAVGWAKEASAQANESGYRLIVSSSSSQSGIFSSEFLSVLSQDFNNGTNSTSNASGADLVQLNRTYAGSTVPVDVYSVASAAGVNASTLCNAITATSNTTLCEEDVRVSKDSNTNTSATPDDPDYPEQWDMIHVTANKAWAAGAVGSSSVRVCMIDAGIDYTHPDIAANMWVNSVEAAGAGATAAGGYINSIDDDGNGIVDDIYGASFVDGAVSGDPMDLNGHGTFVAGVVGAVGNNNLGVTGMNQAISLIACRFMDATGNGWVSDAIQCIDYCISKDAHVMSNSWGGVDYSAALQTAIDSAETHGTLFVASAGNDGVDTDVTAHYPSSMNSSIVLAVGASDSSDDLWARSNYGKTTVQMVAPGVSVLNLGLAGLYVKMTGTSMATPHVTGAAALLLQKFIANGWPITTTENKGVGLQVKQLIISAAASMSTADSAKIAGGLLDTYAALQLVPINPDSSSSSSSSASSSFESGPEVVPEATPEATNPFSSSSAAQSGGFAAAGAASPTPGMTTAPLSASQQAVSSAVQAAAAAAVNVTLNNTRSVFGVTQAVEYGPSGGGFLAPAEGPMGYGVREAHIERRGPMAAPAAAPMAAGAPMAGAEADAAMSHRVDAPAAAPSRKLRKALS